MTWKILSISFVVAAALSGNAAVEDYFPQKVKNFSTAIDFKKDSVAVVYGSLTQPHAIEVAQALEKKWGRSYPILSAEAVAASELKKYHLVVLGNSMDNPLLQTLYFNHKCLLDRSSPGKNGHLVSSVYDPLYAGRNMIIAGGSDAEGHKQAAQALLKIVDKAATPVLKDLFDAKSLWDAWPDTNTTPYDTLVKKYYDEYRTTHWGGTVPNRSWSNFMLYYWTRKPNFKKLGLAALEAYLKKARDNRDDFYGFHPINDVYFMTWKWVAAWELIENDPAFTPRDKKIVLSATWGVCKYIETTLTKTYMNPDINVDNEMRQNHVAYATYSLFLSSRYWINRYGLKEKVKYLDVVRQVFGGQMNTYKPNDDARGYLWYVPNFMISYTLMHGDTSWVENILPRLADAIVTITNNQKMVVPLGDAGGGDNGLEEGARIINACAFFNNDPQLRWFSKWATKDPSEINGQDIFGKYEMVIGGYHADGPMAPPDRYLGIFPALLDSPPLEWTAKRVKNPRHLPRSGARYIDKLSFRRAFDPNTEYLLLEGVSGMSHSHVDGNAIAELSFGPNRWLTDGNYNAKYPEYHSLLQVRKEGRMEQRPILTELLAADNFATSGIATTLSPGLTDADWYRTIFWFKEKGFAVIDEVEAISGGEYDLNNRFHALGDPMLEGRRCFLAQGSARFALANGDDSRLSLQDERNELRFTEPQSSGGFTGFPVNFVMEKIVRLGAGESYYFANLLAPDKSFQLPYVQRLKTQGGALFGVGQGELVFGSARKGLSFDNFSIASLSFILAGQRFEASGLRFLTSSGFHFSASGPVALSVDLKSKEGILTVLAPCNLSFVGLLNGKEWKGAESIGAGKYTLSLPSLSMDGVVSKMFSMGPRPAEPSDDARRSPPFSFGLVALKTASAGGEVCKVETVENNGGLLVGCNSGRLSLFSADLKEKFNADLKDTISALLGADGDRDGKTEYYAGSRSKTLSRFDETGKKIWENAYAVSFGKSDIPSVIRTGILGGRPRLAVGSEGVVVRILETTGKQVSETFIRYHKVMAMEAGDFDGDGRTDLYVGNEYHTPINLLNDQGKRLWHLWDQVGSESRAISKYAGLNLRALSVADLNGDGKKDAVYGTYDGQIFAFDVKAKRLLYDFVGGPVTDLWAGKLSDTARTPVVVVSTKNGDLSIFTATGSRLRYVDIKKQINDIEVADLNGDGLKEILLAAADGSLQAYTADLRLTACHVEQSPAAAVKVLGPVVMGVWRDGRILSFKMSKRNPLSEGIHY